MIIDRLVNTRVREVDLNNNRKSDAVDLLGGEIHYLDIFDNNELRALNVSGNPIDCIELAGQRKTNAVEALGTNIELGVILYCNTLRVDGVNLTSH